MISQLIEIIRKADNHLKIAGYRVLGEHQYINNEYFPNIYIKEVERDISVLRDFMNFAKFERDKEPLFLYLVQKYQENYCPSTFSKWFSDENKLEYLYRRTQIDDILRKIDNPFSDFLPE